MTTRITVKWGRERITLDLPSLDAPLSSLRKSLADYTHLPDHAFKLIHAGAVMKDPSAPISTYNLRPNSTIALIGAADLDQPRALAQPLSQSENSLITTIQAELHAARTSILPDLDLFLRAPMNHKEHLRLGELLLQSLFRLDAAAAEPEWENARKQRKDAVREVQAMLDRLDSAWAARNVTTTPIA